MRAKRVPEAQQPRLSAARPRYLMAARSLQRRKRRSSRLAGRSNERSKLQAKITSTTSAIAREHQPSDADYDALHINAPPSSNSFPQAGRTRNPANREVGAARRRKSRKFASRVAMLSLSNISPTRRSRISPRVRASSAWRARTLASSAERRSTACSYSLRYQDRHRLHAGDAPRRLRRPGMTANVRVVESDPRTAQGRAEDFEGRGEVYLAPRRSCCAATRSRRAPVSRFAPMGAIFAAGSLRRTRSAHDRRAATCDLRLCLGGVSKPCASTRFGGRRGDGWLRPSRPIGELTHLPLSNRDVLSPDVVGLNSSARDLGYNINSIIYKVNDLTLFQRLRFVSRGHAGRSRQSCRPARNNQSIEAMDIRMWERTSTLTPIAELGP